MIWKDVIGYEGIYQVSNKGSVKRMSRAVRCKKGFKILPEMELKLCFDRKGYPVVTLWKGGKKNNRTVHRLVVRAFLGISDLTVNHKDANKTNNSLGNLEYISQADNNRHAKKSLVFKERKDSINKQFPLAERNKIRDLKISGTSKNKLLEDFKIKEWTLKMILYYMDRES